MSQRSRWRSCARACTRERDQHRHVLAIVAIRIAKACDEIVLFELDRNEDVAGRRHREHEMRDRHDRRRPEREQEPCVERMTDEPIGTRRAKTDRLVWLADEVEPY